MSAEVVVATIISTVALLIAIAAFIYVWTDKR